MKGDEPPKITNPLPSNRTLQPLNSDVVPDPPQEPVQPAAAQPLPQTIPAVKQPDASTLVSMEDTADTVWPDPLDVPKEPLLEAPEVLPALDSGSSNPIPPPTPETSDAQLSPFLSDAKVEKRPLGAYNSTEQADTNPTPPVAETDSTTQKPTDDNQLMPQVTLPTSEPLPRELDNDLVALESGDQAVGHQSEDVETLSIPAQAKSAERSTEPAEHPLFDTTDYHAAMPSPSAHKKSSTGKIWLIVLLLAAVAIGVVAYVWVSGMVDFSKLL